VVAGLEVLEIARKKWETHVPAVQVVLAILPTAARKNRLLPVSNNTRGSKVFSPLALTELKKADSEVEATSAPVLSRIVTDPFVMRTRLVGPTAMTGSGGILPV
jgi:hypothetical protein